MSSSSLFSGHSSGSHPSPRSPCSHGSSSTTPQPDEKVLLAWFLTIIQNRHIRTPTQPPVPVHYDASIGGLTDYPWPCDGEKADHPRVVPGELVPFQRTHDVRFPCCLCAYLDDLDYTETRIVIAKNLGSKGRDFSNFLIGEYVAVCAAGRCGYFLCLERFYDVSSIELQLCFHRATPLPICALSTLDEHHLSQSDGLHQVMPDVMLRGEKSKLKVMNPMEGRLQRVAVLKRLVTGVPEDEFWDVFVQCIMCKGISFRSHFATTHICGIPGRVAKAEECRRSFLPSRYRPYRYTTDRSRAGPYIIAARIESLSGDSPEGSSEENSPLSSPGFDGFPEMTSSDVADGFYLSHPYSEARNGD